LLTCLVQTRRKIALAEMQSLSAQRKKERMKEWKNEMKGAAATRRSRRRIVRARFVLSGASLLMKKT
jgi:hypothetical protein